MTFYKQITAYQPNSVDELLDLHYRLLREDFARPVRDSLRYFIFNDKEVLTTVRSSGRRIFKAPNSEAEPFFVFSNVRIARMQEIRKVFEYNFNFI